MGAKRGINMKMRITKIIIFFLLGFFIFTNPLFAKIPSEIKKQLHNDIDILVINKKNKIKLTTISAPGEITNILVIQLAPEDFEPLMIENANKWIANGGTLWFYDSRLADWFGMKNSPLKKDEFQLKETSQQYGENKKAKGSSTIALPASNSPILTGVKDVLAFLLEVDTDKYSAVEISDDENFIPLLKVNDNKKAVAAIQKYGKGLIIFKPLLWEASNDGERFQVNLKEFSAGYDVPLLDSEKNPEDTNNAKNEKYIDKITLRTDLVLEGTILNKELLIETGTGSETIQFEKIKKIELGHTMGEFDIITLTNGSVIKGYAIIDIIYFATDIKDVKKFDRTIIKEIMIKTQITNTENNNGVEKPAEEEQN